MGPRKYQRAQAPWYEGTLMDAAVPKKIRSFEGLTQGQLAKVAYVLRWTFVHTLSE